MQTHITFIGLFAGLCLGAMVFFNGLLAKFINPIQGSFVVHTVGLMTAIVLSLLWKKEGITHAPWWSFLSGIFGGIAVAIFGFSVNGTLGISGTIGAAILGEVIFGWLCDGLGLFGSQKRNLEMADFLQVGLVFLGVGILIYG